MTIRDRIKELRRVPARDLLPNPKNWRKHPERQRQALTAVLKEVGYADALLAREDEQGRLVLVDGHLRAETTPDALVPVLVLDVDATEADKILATLDPLAGMAVCDVAALRELVVSIDALTPEFSDLVTELSPDRSMVEGEDDAPPVPAEPVTRRNDLWILGTHRLLCGDARDSGDLDRLMNGKRADLVFTDPPYNVAYSGRGEVNRLGTIENDDLGDDEFDAFIGTVLSCCAAVMKDVAGIYICHPDSRSAPKISFESHFARHFHKAATIIWCKQAAGMGWQDYRAQHEPILYGWKPGSGSHFFIDDRSKTTVWEIGRDAQATYVHPTQKPVALAQEALLNSSRPGQLVLDLFSGSGSTLIAAEKTGRVARLMELDPKYCDVAILRWQEFTGKTARLESGPSFADVAAERKGDHANAEA